MSGHSLQRDAVPEEELDSMRRQIRKSRWFATNNLNRDFVGTRGFSIVFHRTELPRVLAEFPWSAAYLDLALRADCNAFYLNPLQLTQGSHVAPHIDRSLRAYAPDIDPPLSVSVLYLDVPAGMQGGALVLRRGKRLLGRVTPSTGLLLRFDGDLEHGIDRVETPGLRLSLVCEQYLLSDEELAKVPPYTIESRARSY